MKKLTFAFIALAAIAIAPLTHAAAMDASATGTDAASGAPSHITVKKTVKKAIKKTVKKAKKHHKKASATSTPATSSTSTQ